MLKTGVSKDVVKLSAAFLLVFAAFNGVQQYITTYFSEIGLARIGFLILIIDYVFVFLANPFAAVLVSKIGAKRSMTIAALFYIAFILSILTKSVLLICVMAALLGAFGSAMWIGQNSYLVRTSSETTYGRNSGFFVTIFSLGSALGVLAFGFLIDRISYHNTFLLAAVVAFVGFLAFFILRDVRVKQSQNHLQLLKHAITSKTALKISLIWFSVQFVYGLSIGLIPIEVKEILGVQYIGISSIFYVLPILLSYYFGRLSDIRGRKTLLAVSFVTSIVGLIFLYITQSALFLIAGMFFLALTWAIVTMITGALVGDITTKENLVYISAFFLMVENAGVVSALLLSTITQTRIVYLVSIAILILVFIILLPLSKKDLKVIKQKLAVEVH